MDSACALDPVHSESIPRGAMAKSSQFEHSPRASWAYSVRLAAAWRCRARTASVAPRTGAVFRAGADLEGATTGDLARYWPRIGA
jgi:hypothetical protein